MAEAFARGGRLFVMGNGGGATDAQHIAVEFFHPIIEKRKALPAIALTADPALVTAIANDRDFATVFADQLRVLARPGDMALALSARAGSRRISSGRSRRRASWASSRSPSPAATAGRCPDLADHCFVVPAFSIHRIQETHVTLYHVVWDLVHVALGEDDVL